MGLTDGTNGMDGWDGRTGRTDGTDGRDGRTGRTDGTDGTDQRKVVQEVLADLKISRNVCMSNFDPYLSGAGLIFASRRK